MTVVTADALERAHLQGLLDRQITMVRLPGWIAPHDAGRLAAAMLAASAIRTRHLGMDVDGSKWATDHERIGPSFTSLYREWVSADDRRADILRAYVEGSARTRQAFEAVIGTTPIDRLFARASAEWPAGGVPAELDGTPIFYGSGRVWGGLPALPDPHVDSIHPALYRFDGQLSAVAYLRVPEAGGQLEIWDVEEAEFTQKVIEKKVKRADLPAPTRISPKIGELIIFNARKPHMVAQVTAGYRIVQQCFIGLAHDRPLTFWT
jgi:hypothetical protein